MQIPKLLLHFELRSSVSNSNNSIRNSSIRNSSISSSISNATSLSGRVATAC